MGIPIREILLQIHRHLAAMVELHYCCDCSSYRRVLRIHRVVGGGPRHAGFG